jgi:NlpE N-terminal domain
MTRTAWLVLGAVLAASGCAADDVPPPWPPPEAIPEGTMVGMFEGKFPCADGCEKVKTALLLLQDPVSRAPTRYLQRQIGVGQGNSADDTTGVWRLRQGTKTDADATVCELQPDGGRPLIHYLKVDDNILLLLDEQLRPRVGNASYSFTLSRTR